MKRVIPVWFGLAIALTLGCGRDQTSRTAAAPAAAHDVDRAGMDTSASPGDDFFRYSNGAWLDKTAIPPDRSNYGAGSILFDQAQQRVRALLDADASGAPPAGSDDRRLGDYYASYLDESGIEAKRLEPIRDQLAAIEAIADARTLATRIGESLRADVDPLNNTNFHTDRPFGIWIAQHLDEPDRTVPYLLQGGLSMPDRDYYLAANPRMEATRTAYRAYIAAILTLANIADAKGKATRVYDLERQIAASHTTRTDSVDVTKANNPWPRQEFDRRAPGLDWPALFHGARLDRAPTIIVWHPKAVAGFAALVRTVPLQTWRDYLVFHAIDRRAAVLPRALADAHFGFYEKTLSGTLEQQPRWKRGVNATSGALGEAVGKVYVQRFFPPAAKAQLQAMVANIIAAFDKRLNTLTWMTPSTLASAKAKLAVLKVGIGYPDKWRDYSGLEVVRGDALGNAERAELFDYRQQLDKLERPPDASEWWLTPQTVNAVNLPLQNALNFPAAILEPPFYDPAASAAVRYGAAGAIIGHEISHSFDDQGSQFDARGRLANWWTPQDLAHFKTASAKLVAQYNAYAPFPDLHLNGQLTLSENIADVAGLSATYDAYRAAAAASNVPPTPDDDRSFFVSFAQTWRTKFREELARQITLTDGHALDEYRADTVRNLDAWYTAFDVKPGQRLYLAPADRVQVW